MYTQSVTGFLLGISFSLTGLPGEWESCTSETRVFVHSVWGCDCLYRGSLSQKQYSFHFLNLCLHWHQLHCALGVLQGVVICSQGYNMLWAGFLSSKAKMKWDHVGGGCYSFFCMWCKNINMLEKTPREVISYICSEILKDALCVHIYIFNVGLTPANIFVCWVTICEIISMEKFPYKPWVFFWKAVSCVLHSLRTSGAKMTI